jgi:TPR repeat protein
LQAVQHLYLSSTNFIPWLRDHQAARLAAWQKAAERGHAGAQWLLGLCYGYRICKTENNDGQPAAWCSKAAIQGNVWGKTSLGVILSNKLYGKLVDQVLVNQIMTLFIEAAKQGFAPAQYRLGLMYGQDHGINKDCEQTYNWWYKAAKQGNARAQDNIGSLYNDFPPMHFIEKDEYVLSNFGIKCQLPRDYNQAVIWYLKAAKQGYVRGQYNLGMMYKLGRGVTQDYNQAMNWFLKAAAQEDSPNVEDVWAKRQISSMYEKGLGVAQDHKQAAMWLQKAKAR